MNKTDVAAGCLAFIDGSPSCFHAVENIESHLKQQGYSRLDEKKVWELEAGGSYYVLRNESAIIAFRLPEKEAKGFHIMASHSDSPSFKVKENPEVEADGRYVRLNTEKYGGMILSTWLDRPLSVAGRIVCEQDGRLYSKTVCVDRDLLIIPNLAIHMNRDINKGMEYNPQTDMLPLFAEKKKSLAAIVAQSAGVEQDSILGQDLFLYIRQKGCLLGAEGEFMAAPRLDDLQCAYGTLLGFTEVKPEEYISVYAVFDNEEVGSQTRQGAGSTFLKDVLMNIGEALGKSGNAYRAMVADSFFISADNAHAVHPNHTEKADLTNRPYLNGGIVIKHHGGQKYTTDAYSDAYMKSVCKAAEVPYQSYANRSDIPGGSTLGNISTAQVPIASVDIGLAQLAMHSAVETAGTDDTWYLYRAAAEFYQA